MFYRGGKNLEFYLNKFWYGRRSIFLNICLVIKQDKIFYLLKKFVKSSFILANSNLEVSCLMMKNKSQYNWLNLVTKEFQTTFL